MPLISDFANIIKIPFQRLFFYFDSYPGLYACMKTVQINYHEHNDLCVVFMFYNIFFKHIILIKEFFP